MPGALDVRYFVVQIHAGAPHAPVAQLAGLHADRLELWHHKIFSLVRQARILRLRSERF